MRFKKVFLLLILIGCYSKVFSYNEDIGTRAFQFLKIPSDARANIMIGDIKGIEGLYYNPAGISYIDNIEVLGSYSQLIGEASYFTLAYGFSFFNFLNSKIALGINYLDYGEIKDIINNESENTYDMSVNLGYGLGNQILRAGICFKYLYTKLFITKGYSLGSDIGVDLNLSNFWGINLVFKNLKIFGNINEESVKISGILRVSYFYKKYLNNFALISILAFENIQDEGSYLYPALEIGIGYVFYLRAGYKLNLQSNFQELRGLNLGAGVNLKLLILDFLWCNYYGEAGNLFQISVKLKF
jgi:hypothetical protein